MKGGSVASDSVVSLVTPKTFQHMNSMFTNKVGGCGCSSQQQQQQHRQKGGNIFANMMGSSTLEAFSGNVVAGDQILPPGITGTEAFKPTDLHPANVKPVNAKKVGNPFPKAPNVKVNTKIIPKSNASNIKAFNSRSINSSRPANVVSQGKSGGMLSLSDILRSNSGTKMNVRNRQHGGFTEIGPRVNPSTMSHTPRVNVSNAASTRLLANEAITGPQLINKQIQYGSTADLRNQPFNFGASASQRGGEKSLKVKTVEKLKELKQKQKKPCTVKKVTPKKKTTPKKK